MSERLVVIGGDAAGMSAASQARRLRKDPADLEIVVFEKGDHTSYAACGIPYHVAGLVPSVDDLVVRTPAEFREKQQIDVHTGHEVLGIDTAAGTVEVRDLAAGTSRTEGYDQLLIATGARPVRPPLPGIDLPEVLVVKDLHDADVLFGRAVASEGERVVVVGGGYIGIEMAEAFVLRGARVTLVDALPQVMRTLDPEIAALVERSMADAGVEVRTGAEVTGFEPGAVVLADGRIDADVIVLGIGVTPNSELALAAGIEAGARRAIKVDDHQRTSAERVWSAGDCADSVQRITGERLHIALGTVANRHGRVAGLNLGGVEATFPGVLGTAITKFCDTEIARTGLTEAEAAAAGLDAVSATIEGRTRAHYYPGSSKLTVKLVGECGTGRLLGGQIVGGPGAGKRIDTVATALWARMAAADLIDLDLAYAPPFSPVWDPVAVAGRQLAARVHVDAGRKNPS